MQRALALVALAALAAGGCGEQKSRVGGRLVNNGQPITVPASQVAVTLTPLTADGKPNPGASYTMKVKEDGTFELVASGGQLPPGTYQVSILASGKLAEQVKPFAGDASPIRREIKPGPNDLVIDLAKPSG
jgi:hypothetical protein